MNISKNTQVRQLEPQMKAQLLEYLKKKSYIADNDGVISEFTVDKYARRADLVIIKDNESIAFEIKSEADSLIRLNDQTEKYLQFFDKVILVTTEKHYKKSLEILTINVGIWLICKEKIKIIRKGQKNVIKDKSKILGMMTIRELRVSARKNNYTGDNKNKNEIIKHLMGIKYEKLRHELFNHIKKRYKLTSKAFWTNSLENKVSVKSVENLKRRTNNTQNNNNTSEWLDKITAILSEKSNFKQ